MVKALKAWFEDRFGKFIDRRVVKKKLEEDQSGFSDEPRTTYCRHPDHDLPSMLYVPEGKIYTHVCPGCGRTVKISSNHPIM